MLKILRDNLKYLSWILWLVIAVFIAFVFVDFGGGLSQGGGPTNSVATVGRQSVSQKDFEREYRQLENQYREAFGNQWSSEMADRMRLPEQALQRLVDRSLMLSEANRQGIRVGDREVARAILEIQALKDASGKWVGQEEYARFLRSLGYTTQEFEEAVRGDLTLRRFTALLSNGIAVSDAAVESAWRDQNEKVAVRYVVAPLAAFLAESDPDRATLEGYFAAHSAEFSLPDQRVVDYLLVDEAKLRAGVEIGQEDLEAAYAARRAEFEIPEQVHARHILIKVDDNRTPAEARAVLDTVRARLAKGESFEKLAGELSEDPGSKSRGGDLGFFGRGAMVPAFEQAAFEATPGAVVGPVETSFGVHLIEVLAHDEARTRPLAEVETQLRAELAGERAKELAASRARDLAARIESEKPATAEAWQALADGDTVSFLTTQPFGEEDVVPGIGRGTSFTQTAFALAEGAASAPVQVPRGWAVLRLKEKIAAHVPTLDEVEPRVRAAAQRARASELAMAELKRAKALAESGRGFDQVATALGLEIRDSGEISRRGNVPGVGAAKPLAEAALALAPGSIGGPLAVAQGAVLFEVTSRAPFDAGRFAAESDTLRQGLERDELNRIVASVLARRREEAGVRYDPALSERLGLGGDASGG